MSQVDLVGTARKEFSPPRMHDRRFFITAALLFVASAAVTVIWCASMSAMEGMAMPGGWTMSMTWMRMPGQTWLAAAMAFLGMWVVMMVAMMLPPLLPILRRYRRAVVGINTAHLDWLTAGVAVGYFAVWTLLGMAIFPLGVLFASLAMHVPALASKVPMLAGVVVAIAGAMQFTPWKMHHLNGCRHSLDYGYHLRPDGITAWRHGLRLGLRCCYCCASQTAVLLAVGVMNPGAMVIVAAAISAERLAPAGERIACATGGVAIAAGVFMVMQSTGA